VLQISSSRRHPAPVEVKAGRSTGSALTSRAWGSRARRAENPRLQLMACSPAIATATVHRSKLSWGFRHPVAGQLLVIQARLGSFMPVSRNRSASGGAEGPAAPDQLGRWRAPHAETPAAAQRLMVLSSTTAASPEPWVSWGHTGGSHGDIAFEKSLHAPLLMW
jgi:hypothetical protein